jgi:hypothetical protein
VSGLEDRLSLDISEALSAVSQLESAFVSAAKTAQESFEAAVTSIELPDLTLDFEANVDEVTPAIDEAIASADTDITLDPDAGQLTFAIDEAISSADSEVEVTADITEAAAALDSLSDTTVAIEVDTTGIDEAAASLGDVAAAGSAAGQGGQEAAAGIGQANAAAAIAGGEFSRATGILEGFGARGAAAAGVIGVLTIAGKEFFDAGLASRSATERFNLSLGEFADNVNRIDVGGLNEDLQTLGVRLGSDDEALQNAAANIFELGRSSQIAEPQIADATENIIALAARAVALKPSLGDVGDAAQGLTTALARGGRFLANYNVSLSTAEINARAFANTGKTIASDLTVAEKSFAGAQLAVEKLGGSLSTDINEGADNIAFKFRAIRGEFEETLDTLGEPLLDPLLAAAEAAQPSLTALAAVFGEILASLAPLADDPLSGLQPAMAGLVPLAQALGGALDVVAGILDIIPDPLKAAVVGFVALNAALRALAATKVATNLISSASALERMRGLAGPAAVGILGIGAAISFVNSQVEEGEQNVSDFLAPFVETGQSVQSIEELERALSEVTATAVANREALAGNRGGLFGDFFEKGQSRDFESAAVGLESIARAETALITQARNLQTSFGLSSEAALDLARRGDDVVAAFIEQNAALDPYLRGLAEAARATDEFWLAASAGALSAADIQEQATSLGITFEDLAADVSEARQPVIDFANQVIESLPGASEALAELNEKGSVSLQSFLDTFTTKTLEAAQFVGNIRALVDRGATDLAAEIQGQGAEAGAALAAEAARLTDAELAKAEENIDRIRTIRANNAADLQGIADDLNGGIQLRQQAAGEELGKQLELIPGQVDAKAEAAGGEIGTALAEGTVNSILGSAEFEALPDDLAVIGVEAGGALVGGVAEGIETQTTALLDPVIRRLKDETKRILEDVFLISSPSRLTQEIGELVAEGFVVGLADIEGAADVVDPIISKMDKLKLGAEDLAKATGSSVEEIVASLDALGAAEKEITPDELIDIGKAVDALGGSKGVKALQDVLAKQVSAAFGGLDAKAIEAVVSKLNTQAALSRVTSIVGVTPSVPTPFETNVVKGADSSAPNVTINQTLTPPPEATPFEMAILTAQAAGWVLQGVQ